MKPESNWPVSLDDLIEKLSTIKIEETFHQPFDLKGEFEEKAKSFIRNKFKLLKKNNEDNSMNLEYATKALQAFLSLNILQGSHSKMAELLDFLRELKNDFGEILDVVFEKSIKECEGLLKELCDYLSNLSDLPILRNYLINDFFEVTKNVLYSSNSRYGANSSTSITCI